MSRREDIIVDGIHIGEVVHDEHGWTLIRRVGRWCVITRHDTRAAAIAALSCAARR